MSKLLYLTDDDFRIVDGPDGKTLCMSIKGFSLVLFYSKQCIHCHSFIPKFKQIPQMVSGCQFGLVNVSSNVNIVKMSESTVSPIKYVPYILLYINGKPFMQYDGPRTSKDVREFIVNVSKQLNEKQYFSNIQAVKKPKPEDSIPPYCIAKPKCDGDVCYLSFDSAYG